MKKASSNGTDFAKAMGDLISKIAIADIAAAGKEPNQILEKDLIKAQARIETCVAQTHAAMVQSVYEKIDSPMSTAFFSYVIAKAIGYERAFSAKRNPVKERKQVKHLVRIFQEGLEHMIDRIEIETKKAVKDGLLDADAVRAAFEDAGTSAEKETEEKSDHQSKMVILPD